MTRKKAKQQFWIYGGLGSLVLGFGLCLLVESGFIKHSDAPSWHWVTLGTLSLILIMSGINFLLRSFKSSLEMNRKQKNKKVI